MMLYNMFQKAKAAWADFRTQPIGLQIGAGVVVLLVVGLLLL